LVLVTCAVEFALAGVALPTVLLLLPLTALPPLDDDTGNAVTRITVLRFTRTAMVLTYAGKS
jgi:hypothetical protein